MESSRQHDLNEYAKDVMRHKARQLIGRYGFTRDDYEDLKQEMALDWNAYAQHLTNGPTAVPQAGKSKGAK